MKQLLALILLLFAPLMPAHGASRETPVTQTNLDQQNYVFAVSTATVTNGVEFHVTITAKQEDFSTFNRVDIALVTHRPDSATIAPVKPAIPIALAKKTRVWEARFTATPAMLATPGLCFIFVENAHMMEHGKVVGMPAADYYELELRSFSKP